MSNVSDTNEIVAGRLLFPLARTFLVGGSPARHGRFHWRAKALAWSEHLFQRRKCMVRPRNVPKRCIWQWRPRMERDICLGWPVDL